MTNKQVKYEFDTWEEYKEAMKHLEDYHNCEKCRGKIVAIQGDIFGNTHCAYCGERVDYPHMKKEKFEEMIKKSNLKVGEGSKNENEIICKKS